MEQPIEITGQGMDIGQALTTHVEDKLSDEVNKYFDHAVAAHVVFKPEGGHLVKVRITLATGTDIMLKASAEADDPYHAFDTAANKMIKQLRRYKKKLRDHRKRQAEERKEFEMKARYNVLESPLFEDLEGVGNGQPVPAAEQTDQADEDGPEPVVIADLSGSTSVQQMTVEEAVMRLDLSEKPAIMFKNESHGGLNMLYKRDDGHIGWVDPQGEMQEIHPESQVKVKKKAGVGTS
jgi:ribosomal subunit interface protein